VTEVEEIELAKAYVALSNAHRLVLIVPMFVDQAVYYSSYVGEFRGRIAIEEMMADFFSRFPDVHWKVPEYRRVAKGVVEFPFLMSATELQSGNRIEREGLERVEYSDNNLISRLEVNSG